MLAVGLPQESIKSFVARFDGQVSIAAINSPTSVTLSGDADALEELRQELELRRTGVVRGRSGGRERTRIGRGAVLALGLAVQDGVQADRPALFGCGVWPAHRLVWAAARSAVPAWEARSWICLSFAAASSRSGSASKSALVSRRAGSDPSADRPRSQASPRSRSPVAVGDGSRPPGSRAAWS